MFLPAGRLQSDLRRADVELLENICNNRLGRTLVQTNPFRIVMQNYRASRTKYRHFIHSTRLLPPSFDLGSEFVLRDVHDPAQVVVDIISFKNSPAETGDWGKVRTADSALIFRKAES